MASIMVYYWSPDNANEKDKDMIYKTLHIKLKIEQHELHYNPGVNTCALEE